MILRSEGTSGSAAPVRQSTVSGDASSYGVFTSSWSLARSAPPRRVFLWVERGGSFSVPPGEGTRSGLSVGAILGYARSLEVTMRHVLIASATFLTVFALVPEEAAAQRGFGGGGVRAGGFGGGF